MEKRYHYKKPGDFHKIAKLEAPEHPLISLIDYSTINYSEEIKNISWQQDYYTIGIKRNVPYKMYYGQQSYDFDEGIMSFIAPDQVMCLKSNPNVGAAEPTGWLLLVHPDFLWNTPLAKQIKKYDFFDYSVNEALFLSEKEEQQVLDLFKNICNEYKANIDRFSQKIIIAQLELLLNYAERFYERQFITRQISNNKIVSDLETVLNELFMAEELQKSGLPTVHEVAERVHLSPNYLSNVLKTLTGESTQTHIHNKLISIAKEQLSGSFLSVSEIAYNLGFEQPASFSKLFKNKTTMSPLAFRKSYQN